MAADPLLTSAQFSEVRRKRADLDAKLRQMTSAERERRRGAAASIRDAALGYQPMINGGTVRRGRREIFGASAAKWLRQGGQGN
jgi:hypothetical protein